MRLRALALVVFGLVAWLLVWPAVHPYLDATALILDLTGQQPALRQWLPVGAESVTTRDLSVPARHGAIDARFFEPAAPRGHTIAIFPGVHGGGLDEPRMNALARRFAEHGLRVLIAPLPELRRYTIRPRSTDDVEDVSAWLAAQPDLAPSGRIGLVGVSFAGGLALVAAGRPSLDGKLVLVAAMGAHGDLPRAMRYLCTGVLPDGTVEPPHDYGAVIILLAALPHFVPADQVEPLRDVILTFLDASSLDVTDPPRSAELFAAARRRAATLPEPAREVMSWVNARDVDAIGPKLLPYLEELGGAPALSPERSPATRAPVFLIHGAHDNVIPYSETPQLAAYLSARGNSRVTSLLTPLISHANVDAGRPPLRDVWAVIRFWSAMIRALEAA